MDFAQYETIRFERRGRILYAILNQPDKLNAIAGRAHLELSSLFNDIADDPDCDVAVLTGAGRAFSAGGDLAAMEHSRENPADFFKIIREAKRVVYSILDCEKPLVCKVNGDAIGLGATLALFCDVAIAAEHARFGDLHNNVAMVAGDGGQVIWPQLIGYGRARHYLLTGERITGREAAEIGLIYRAVPAAQLDAEVDAYADRLAALPAQSLRWTKAGYSQPLRQLAHGMMDAGMSYEALASMTTADSIEAIQAIREKRKPQFRGC